MPAETPHLDKGAILIVDDEAPIGQLLQQWLAADGYRTHFAQCFPEVQAALEQAPYDVVTLDILMPQVSGLAILPWIRRHYPDTAVIMATALVDLDTVLEAMRLGATNYLLKPFNLELVSEEVARAMERQRLIAENRSYQQTLEDKVEVQTRQIRRAHRQLERRLRELQARDRLLRFQMCGPSFDAACAETLSVLDDVLGVEGTILFQPGPQGEGFQPVAARGLSCPGQAEDAAVLAGLGLPSPSGQGRAPAGPEPGDLVLRAATSSQYCETDTGQVAIPLMYRDEVLGVVWIAALGDACREQALQTLTHLARQAAVLLWSARVIDDLDSGQLEIDELLGME